MMGGKLAEGARTREDTLRLPESDDELREFLDQATIGLRWMGPDGRILWANRAELEMVGCSEHEYVDHNIGEFFEEPEAAAELLARLARKERVEGYQARLRAKDGSLKSVLIDASALFRGGRFVHSRCVTRDITPLLEREVAARQRAEETSRLKDEFLALLSHELRSPLGTILVWLGLLQEGGLHPAERERALGVIERGARSLERIIEDLLHASRIAAGGLMLTPQLVDLRGVVRVAVDAASADAALKGVVLTSSYGEIPIWAMGDPGRLQQAVSNLLSNAIKFTPTGGRVQVGLDVIDRQARLRVTDTGEGMSPEFLPLAFERFRQQDSTSTRAHHGLGLGLYVVRHVIGHHGGLVSAESPGPGRGSTFTVLLPLATHKGEASPTNSTEPHQSEASPPPAGLTVVLVDDEEDAREALRLILQQNGMLVMTAASAGEAFALVERLRPDILLSDIAMPGEDGLSLIRRVRMLPIDRGGQVPAAALSAYAGAEDHSKALKAGFQQHIPKPVDPVHLLAVIATMARKSVGRVEEG
jgi:PAS domain S-box-containing protein